MTPSAASFDSAAPPADPLDRVTLDELSQQHDDHHQWATLWPDLRLLYKGGWEFLIAAGGGTTTRASLAGTAQGISVFDQMANAARRRRFLWQFEAEPDVKYYSIWEKAQYTNYFGAIINYFRHWLFSKPAAVRPVPETAPDPDRPGEQLTLQPDAPEWYPGFSSNCTGGGESLDDFLKRAFLEALLFKRSGWLIGRPPLAPDAERSIEGQYLTQRDAEDMGLTTSLLALYTADEIVDWQRDGGGELLWVVLRKKLRVRDFPARRGEVELYTYCDRSQWRTWRASRDGQQNAKLELLGAAQHGLGVVPFVMLELPHDLWVANQIFSLCVQIFNRQNRLHSAELLSCFPQPTLTSNDPDAKDRVMGEGMMLALRAGNPKTGDPAEAFGYAATPTAPYEFIKGSIDATIQELYRAVHQLSLAVDAKSTSAIARSGVSKQEDRKSIEVILSAFGGYVREAIVRTCNLVSSVQGDATKWSVEGFDDFDVSDLMDELQTAGLVSTLDIHSRTFKQEFEKRIATGRLLGQASPEVRTAVEREITQFYEEQAEAEENPPQAQLVDPLGNPIPPTDPAPEDEPPAPAAAPEGA